MHDLKIEGSIQEIEELNRQINMTIIVSLLR